MKKITKPTFKVKEVFLDCIENVCDIVLKKALNDGIAVIERTEADFDVKKILNQLHLIPQNEMVNTTVNSDVLKGIYTDRMLKKKNKGRVHYDNILLSAHNGKCPLCSQRIATTLDHYLPKSLYPLLSITPINLIPACSDCNKGKLVDSPTNSKEETLHPYYDDVESFSWLKMKLVQAYPFEIDFYVNAPAHISQLLKDRIENHFCCFKLNQLYTTHAVEEFENITFQLTKLYKNGGNPCLKEHLKDCYDSRNSINKNSWQTAFYEELVNSENSYGDLFKTYESVPSEIGK